VRPSDARRAQSGSTSRFSLLPLLLTKVPGDLGRFTPLLIIANSVAAVVHQTGSVSPAVGLALFAGYTVVIVLLGAAVITRRDP